MAQLIEMKVEEIKVAKFNPASRTERSSLRKLMKDIEAAGRVIQPLVVGSDGVLADGHRRLACAKALGLKTVPVLLEDKPARELWVILNHSPRIVRGRDWLEAYVSGLSARVMPEEIAKQINELEKAVGKTGLEALVANHRGIGILRMAQVVARYVGDTTPDMIGKIIRWFETHEQQNVAKLAIKDECEPEDLLRAIEECRPLRRRWT